MAVAYAVFSAKGLFPSHFGEQQIEPRRHGAGHRNVPGRRNIRQPELAAAGQAAYDALAASMERGIANGFFRDMPVQALAMAVWAMVHGLTELAITGHLLACGEAEGEEARISESACALLLSGLAPFRPGA